MPKRKQAVTKKTGKRKGRGTPVQVWGGDKDAWLECRTLGNKLGMTTWAVFNEAIRDKIPQLKQRLGQKQQN